MILRHFYSRFVVWSIVYDFELDITSFTCAIYKLDSKFGINKLNFGTRIHYLSVGILVKQATLMRNIAPLMIAIPHYKQA